MTQFCYRKKLWSSKESAVGREWPQAKRLEVPWWNRKMHFIQISVVWPTNLEYPIRIESAEMVENHTTKETVISVKTHWRCIFLKNGTFSSPPPIPPYCLCFLIEWQFKWIQKLNASFDIMFLVNSLCFFAHVCAAATVLVVANKGTTLTREITWKSKMWKLTNFEMRLLFLIIFGECVFWAETMASRFGAHVESSILQWGKLHYRN